MAMRIIKLFAYMVFTMLLPLWLFHRAGDEKEPSPTKEDTALLAAYRAENAELRGKNDQLLKENAQLSGANAELKREQTDLSDRPDAGEGKAVSNRKSDEQLPDRLPPMVYYLKNIDDDVPILAGVDTLLIRDTLGRHYQLRLEQPSEFQLNGFVIHSNSGFGSTKYSPTDVESVIPPYGHLMLNMRSLRKLPDPITIVVTISVGKGEQVQRLFLKIQRN